MNPSFALAPFSALYGAVVRARLSLYRRAFLKSARVDAPVISVGNITAGGTGKTPLVGWLARVVAREGRRACVLSRGYGRRDERERVVVSDGESLLAGADAGGDEPRLLAEQLLGAASVVSDADRAGAARWAIANLGAEVFILDDGFQHMRLARDLDIVTIDATAPWGGGYLLPRGRLREPTSGLRRADCVVITRAELIGDTGPLRDEIGRLTRGGALVLESSVRTTGVRPLDSASEIHPDGVSTQPAAAFCATGNPQAFFKHLRDDGHHLIHTRAFPDHHAFLQDDLDALVIKAESRGGRLLLTTAKDAVKLRSLRSRLPIYVVEIEPVFDDEERLVALVRRAISRGGAGSGAGERSGG